MTGLASLSDREIETQDIVHGMRCPNISQNTSQVQEIDVYRLEAILFPQV